MSFANQKPDRDSSNWVARIPSWILQDIEAQKELEMRLRAEEEEMYRRFQAERKEKENVINDEIKVCNDNKTLILI